MKIIACTYTYNHRTSVYSTASDSYLNYLSRKHLGSAIRQILNKIEDDNMLVGDLQKKTIKYQGATDGVLMSARYEH